MWSALVADDAPDVVGHALRAAASTPSPFFVPHLVEAAGSRVHEGPLAQALAAHAEHLGPALGSMLVDRHGSRRVRERLVRAVTAAGGRVAPVAFDVDAALQDQRIRAARARGALTHLDESPSLDPLRRALLDDLAAWPTRRRRSCRWRPGSGDWPAPYAPSTRPMPASGRSHTRPSR